MPCSASPRRCPELVCPHLQGQDFFLSQRAQRAQRFIFFFVVALAFVVENAGDGDGDEQGQGQGEGKGEGDEHGLGDGLWNLNPNLNQG